MGGEKLRFTALDHLDRPFLNQTAYDAQFGTQQTLETGTHRFKRNLKRAFLSSCSSKQAFKESILTFIPILSWLPSYDWATYFLSDVIGGVTSGIMNIPQGISYSLLAGVAPVYGIYASCFPAFFYMVFGTSKHTSLGSFAVVALMAGIARETVMEKFIDATAIEVATCIAFSVGIWQILCGLLRLQFILSFFSAPLVSGFSTGMLECYQRSNSICYCWKMCQSANAGTEIHNKSQDKIKPLGAAMHVFVTQIDDIMGVVVPNASGPGYLFTRIKDLFSRVDQANISTIIISGCTITFLVIGKELVSPGISRKIKLRFPIPYELLAMVISTAFSVIFAWRTKFGVMTVGDIPAGLPKPSIPTLEILPACLKASISIAIVSIAVHVSMAKMLANQFGYKVDELYALGLSSCLGSMFPIYAVSTALGRTMVAVRSGTKTQLSNLFSCALLMIVILWLGPFLTELPKCVLASVIVVALQPMFEKFSEPMKLWNISKYDSITWVVACFSTIFIDVMEGLAIALIFAILTVVMRTQWPHWQYFVPDTKNTDIAMFKFEGPLQFTNSERFKKGITYTIDEWQGERPSHFDRYFIIDCSPMVYVDSVGVIQLKDVCKDLEEKNISVLIAGMNMEVRQVLRVCGFNKVVPEERFFPSVGDAVGFVKTKRIEAFQVIHPGKIVSVI